MKTLILALWLGCWVVGATAQELKITRVKKGEEPKTVMDAIDRDFPGAITKDLSFISTQLYGNEWNVDIEGNLALESNVYEVQIRRGNESFIGVYDKNGTLLSSKQIKVNAKLPAEVKATLNKFTGWHVDKTTEIIKYYRLNKKETVTDTYKVKLQKGAEHKIIFIDATGNIINTRFTIG